MSDKPRLVQVTESREIAAINASLAGEIDSIAGMVLDGIWYADADELKRWRERRAAETVSDAR